jgi:MscS family membrane protein
MNAESLHSLMDRLIGPFRSWATTVDKEALLIAAVFVAIIFVLRRPIAAALTTLIGWILGALKIDFNDDVHHEVKKALQVMVVVVALLLVHGALALPELFGGLLRRTLISVLVAAVFAMAYRLMEAMVRLADSENSLMSVAVNTRWLVRLGQVVVVVLAVTSILAVWDIDIANALTGVGVFGAGLAIAAQDLVRNLVAGMTNMSERRFKVGDWICVENGVEGIVRRIDVRSTMVQGFDRVPRFVPNADLANAVVMNKTRMDHWRINWTVPLVLDTTEAQLKSVCETLQDHLKDSGDFVTDGSLMLLVKPCALSETSVDVMIYAFTLSDGYAQYLETCSQLVSAIRAAVSEAGTKLAYPTQTIQLRQAPGESEENGSE